MRIYLIAVSVLLAGSLYSQEKKGITDTTLLQPIELIAVRAGEKIPMVKTTLTKKEIEKYNIGQDLPFLLDQTPSVVVNSDAGNGIGYTGIRIRGTDASRINVTLNSIPYNDAESQGTFFVDLPDIASSAGSIQVQRGVGTSTNGSGSFGGTININTNEIKRDFALESNNTVGSFNSLKNTVSLNSGLLRNHFTFDARFSNIRSDGYIDRASSRLRSFFTSLAYLNAKSSLRFNIFTGNEKTYQAWYGVSESMLPVNRKYNSAGTEKPGEPYDNETDNYTQTHYQGFYNRKLSASWKTSLVVFLTRGKGYYEQYKADQTLSDYGLPEYNDGGTIISSTDLVRRLWLDNYFYGSILTFTHARNKDNWIMGANWNSYDGKHYGDIPWATTQAAVPVNYRWYNLTAYKQDYSAFFKWDRKLNGQWLAYLDLQGRVIHYKINGFRNNPGLLLSSDYFFFNPKAGMTYTNGKISAYASYARSNKEPNRDDFETGTNGEPAPEILNDFETGMEWKEKTYSIGLNFFYMHYKDQLILTGKINDVGAYTRTNIPKSYRTGIEVQGKAKFSSWVSLSGSMTWSENKIKDYTEYLDDYDNGGQQTNFYNKTTISYSPSLIGAATLNFYPLKNTEINLIGKYVGRQFLDNTSQQSRSLDPFYIQNIRAGYEWKCRKIKSIQLFAQVNNVFSAKYTPNGYSFSYVYGGETTTENYYFPMALVNYVAGLNIRL